MGAYCARSLRADEKSATRKIRVPIVICCVLIAGVLGGVVAQIGTATAASPNAWSIVPSPKVASVDNVLSGVSCVSTTNCTAVGDSSDGTTSQTLVESWNGTAWALVPSPNPPGNNGTDNALTRVSCVTSTFCMAVGQSNATAGLAQPLTESWNGSTWSIVPSPNPSSTSNVFLEGVSCVSTTNCKAVGWSNTPPTGYPIFTLIESWNGVDWSIVPSPNPGGSTLLHGPINELSGVSCVNPTSCTAVGDYVNADTNTYQTLIEGWNGSDWFTIASPNGSESTYSTVSLARARRPAWQSGMVSLK